MELMAALRQIFGSDTEVLLKLNEASDAVSDAIKSLQIASSKVELVRQTMGWKRDGDEFKDFVLQGLSVEGFKMPVVDPLAMKIAIESLSAKPVETTQ